MRAPVVARCTAAGAALLATSCGDLFHGTDWSTRCGGATCVDAGATGGAAGAGAGTGNGSSGGGGAVACTPGGSASCYTGPAATEGVGVCKAGTKTCLASGTEFGPCAGEITPSAEQCNNAIDEDCDGSLTNGCSAPQSCAGLMGQPSGVYTIDPDGAGPTSPLSVWCDMTTEGGGWALLYNSIGSGAGLTPAFWQIAYADRLGVKGKPQLYENFYAGALYPFGKEYRDEFADMDGKAAQAFRATVQGFDAMEMKFLTPAFVSGVQAAYDCQLAAGWASTDHDADPSRSNCAALYLNVTQHYCACWYYNLGADADDPHEDGLWGPHINSETFASLGLAGDGTAYSRVARISRWVRW